jgi:broad specificity phosphatase PhoE
MSFYFIRHAESQANDKKILAGHLDFPLSIQGKKDIENIAGEFFKKVKIDMIISSPLKRALETASAFSKLYGLMIEKDDKLIEQNLGIYSGMSYDEIETEEGYEHDRTKRWNWVPEKGESYKMVADRVRPFFENILSVSENLNILVVTHAVTLRLIRGILENTLPLYPENIAQNGEIWKVDFKGIGKFHKIDSIFLDKESVRTHQE